jgi:hypothetical protein
VVIGSSCDVPVPPPGDTQIQISGAVNQTITGRTVAFEPSDRGYKFSIFRQSIGGKIQMLTIGLPENLVLGTYTISPDGLVTAGYYFTNDGSTRAFVNNDQGTLTIKMEENNLSTTMDFSLDEDSGATVRITGRIWGVPYKEVGGLIQPLDPAEISEISSGKTSSLAGLGMTFFLVILFIGNFIFQFMVGTRVYAGQGSTWLRSLRGTRTFIRGWGYPDLQHLMILWSILLVALLLFMFGIIFLAIS